MAFGDQQKFDKVGCGYGYPQPTLSDSTDDPAGPFRGIDVFATGTVSFVGVDGATYTTPSIATVPFRIDCGVRRVRSTGTTVAATNLRGIK